MPPWPRLRREAARAGGARPPHSPERQRGPGEALRGRAAARRAPSPSWGEAAAAGPRALGAGEAVRESPGAAAAERRLGERRLGSVSAGLSPAVVSLQGLQTHLPPPPVSCSPVQAGNGCGSLPAVGGQLLVSVSCTAHLVSRHTKSGFSCSPRQESRGLSCRNGHRHPGTLKARLKLHVHDRGRLALAVSALPEETTLTTLTSVPCYICSACQGQINSFDIICSFYFHFKTVVM